MPTFFTPSPSLKMQDGGKVSAHTLSWTYIPLPSLQTRESRWWGSQYYTTTVAPNVRQFCAPCSQSGLLSVWCSRGGHLALRVVQTVRGFVHFPTDILLLQTRDCSRRIATLVSLQMQDTQCATLVSLHTQDCFCCPETPLRYALCY